MKKLARDFGIKIIWFYEEPGHGHGLVGAMSLFGCKQQFCHEIVSGYHLVDAAKTAIVRANKSGELELKPCKKFHVTAVKNDGIFSKTLYFTNPDIVTTIFNLIDDANHNANTDEEIDDDQIDEPSFSLN